MSSRPTNWHPLCGSDPTPGDPTIVRDGAQHYRDIAAAMGRAQLQLDTILNLDGVKSDAVLAMLELASTVKDGVRKTTGRYQTAGDALSTYADALVSAQSRADAALVSAQAAQQTIDSATDTVSRTQRLLDQCEDTDTDSQNKYKKSLNAAKTSRTTADTNLASARDQLTQAIADRDAAATHAEGIIREKIDSDELNDGWWENWGSSVAHVVSEWCSKIATVAGILALVFAWVPGLGQALALIAGIAGAIGLIADFLLAYNGEGSWVDVAIGVLGVVSLGLGRSIGTSLKAASTTLSRLTQSRGTFSALARAAGELPNGRLIQAAKTAWQTSGGWKAIASGFNPAGIFKDLGSSVKNIGGITEIGSAFNSMRTAPGLANKFLHFTGYAGSITHTEGMIANGVIDLGTHSLNMVGRPATWATQAGTLFNTYNHIAKFGAPTHYGLDVGISIITNTQPATTHTDAPATVLNLN